MCLCVVVWLFVCALACVCVCVCLFDVCYCLGERLIELCDTFDESVR